MAHWVRCTTIGGAENDTFINLDLIVTMTPRASGARLVYSDGHTGYVDVAEPPSAILAAVEVGQARGLSPACANDPTAGAA